MRLHDALDQRSAALELFDRCAATLRDELQLEPLPETRFLADRIRARQRPGRPSATAGPAVGTAAARLDLQNVPLVARDRELAALIACSEPVVLVEGDAGVGKTRLVIAALQRAARVDDDGAPVAPESVLRVRFTEMSSLTPFQAVIDALREPAIAARLAGLGAVHRNELSRWLPGAGLDPSGGAAGTDPVPAPFRARLLEALVQALALASGPSRALLFIYPPPQRRDLPCELVAGFVIPAQGLVGTAGLQVDAQKAHLPRLAGIERHLRSAPERVAE